MANAWHRFAAAALVWCAACKPTDDTSVAVDKTQPPEIPEPAEPACPPFSVTQDGKPIEFDAAKAHYDPNVGTLEVTLLRDNPIPCKHIVTGWRSYAGNDPKTRLEIGVQSNLKMGIGVVAAQGINKIGKGAEVIADERQEGGRIALCVHRPVTLETKRQGTLVVHGLIEGAYCGETPLYPEDGLIEAADCPKLELRVDGKATTKYRALAFGRPEWNLEIGVFVDDSAVSCETLASDATHPWAWISADEMGGRLEASGHVAGSRFVRPVVLGETPGDQVSLCVPKRQEWDGEEQAVIGLIEATYCGRDPRPSIWDR